MLDMIGQLFGLWQNRFGCLDCTVIVHSHRSRHAYRNVQADIEI